MKAPLRAAGASLVLALAGCSGLRSQAPETVSYLLRAPATAPRRVRLRGRSPRTR